MRLSEIKGDKVFDVIADVIGPMANIASDEEATELFRRKPLPEGVTVKDFIIERAKRSIPVLLKRHKHDLICILSAIEGVSADEYTRDLSLLKLMSDCTDLLTDEAFVGLFTSAQSENSSGFAPGTTRDPQTQDSSPTTAQQDTPKTARKRHIEST